MYLNILLSGKKVFFLLVLFFSLACGQENFQGIVYNVTEFGAVPDGATKNTDAIKKAIDEAEKQGGGTVYFPAGIFLTGPIHLKSNITLYVDAGAVIKFSDDFNDYLPMVHSRWEGTEVINFSPLIYANKAENISICGRGLIDGQGKKWWNYVREYNRDPSKDAQNGILKWQKEFAEKNKNSATIEFWKNYARNMPAPFLRPSMIQPYECKNVLIEGVSLQDPPMWTVHPVYCENVTVTEISINNPAISPNTDGINPDACRYVHISNSHISVGDDCITIKSGRDEDGRRVGRACENITITNCTMLNGHGGVVIGSEMSGDVRKVVVSNCVFDGTDRGVRIKSMRGRGGVVEEVRFNNIVMKNIKREAIVLNMFYHQAPPEPVSERTPSFRNIHLSDITVSNAQSAGKIMGLPEMPVEGVSLENINIEADEGFYIQNAKNISFHDVSIVTKQGPILTAEMVSNLELDGVQTQEPHPGIAVIDLKNIADAFIHGCNPVTGTGAFVKLSGKNNQNISLTGNNFIAIKNPVLTTKDVSNSVWVIQ